MIDKMIGRRGILGLLGAAVGGAAVAPAATASGIGVKAAAAALGVDPNPVSGDLLEGCSVGLPCASGSEQGWRIANLITTRMEAMTQSVDHMPPHIAGKKSWSRSYKAMIHSREQVVIHAYLDRLRNDQNSHRTLLALLGIDLAVEETNVKGG